MAQSTHDHSPIDFGELADVIYSHAVEDVVRKLADIGAITSESAVLLQAAVVVGAAGVTFE